MGQVKTDEMNRKIGVRLIHGGVLYTSKYGSLEWEMKRVSNDVWSKHFGLRFPLQDKIPCPEIYCNELLWRGGVLCEVGIYQRFR